MWLRHKRHRLFKFYITDRFRCTKSDRKQNGCRWWHNRDDSLILVYLTITTKNSVVSYDIKVCDLSMQTKNLLKHFRRRNRSRKNNKTNSAYKYSRSKNVRAGSCKHNKNAGRNFWKHLQSLHDNNGIHWKYKCLKHGFGKQNS